VPTVVTQVVEWSYTVKLQSNRSRIVVKRNHRLRVLGCHGQANPGSSWVVPQLHCAEPTSSTVLCRCRLHDRCRGLLLALTTGQPANPQKPQSFLPRRFISWPFIGGWIARASDVFVLILRHRGTVSGFRRTVHHCFLLRSRLSTRSRFTVPVRLKCGSIRLDRAPSN